MSIPFLSRIRHVAIRFTTDDRRTLYGHGKRSRAGSNLQDFYVCLLESFGHGRRGPRVCNQNVEVIWRADPPTGDYAEFTVVYDGDAAARVPDHHRVQVRFVRTETARSPFCVHAVGSDKHRGN